MAQALLPGVTDRRNGDDRLNGASFWRGEQRNDITVSDVSAITQRISRAPVSKTPGLGVELLPYSIRCNSALMSSSSWSSGGVIALTEGVGKTPRRVPDFLREGSSSPRKESRAIALGEYSRQSPIAHNAAYSSAGHTG